jgi:hypothetical protein
LSRDISSAAATHYAGEHVSERVFVYIDFDSGAVRLHDGWGDITWDSQTWSGIGDFGGISGVQESPDGGARTVTLRISGVDTANVVSALDRTDYKGRTVEIYVGVCDADGDLLDDPDLMWRGSADVASVTMDKNTAEIELQCENELADLVEPNLSRFSDEDHQLRYPGDLFFEHMPQMIDRNVKWGDFSYYGGDNNDGKRVVTPER